MVNVDAELARIGIGRARIMLQCSIVISPYRHAILGRVGIPYERAWPFARAWAAGQLSPYRQIAKQLSSALHLYIILYTFI